MKIPVFRDETPRRLLQSYCTTSGGVPACFQGKLVKVEFSNQILYFVDHASAYSLVNNTNLVHNLLLVHLSISTCFGRLCAHHQEKQLCLCDTWYFLFCVDDCLVCRVEFSDHIEDAGSVFLGNVGKYIPINTDSFHETRVF
jgi:hypothetical protein